MDLDPKPQPLDLSFQLPVPHDTNVPHGAKIPVAIGVHLRLSILRRTHGAIVSPDGR
jgi:hypothetical protein